MMLIYFCCLQPAPLRRGGEDKQEVPGGAKTRGLHIPRLAWRPPQVSFSLSLLDPHPDPHPDPLVTSSDLDPDPSLFS